MRKHNWLRWTLAAALLLFTACNNDDDFSRPDDTPTPQATNTASAVPTATAEPEPTATSDDHGGEHVEVEIGSNEDGDGQLVAEIAFEQPFPLFFIQCFGGTDDDCTGGQALFSDANPGFVGHHEHDEEAAAQGAEEGVFPLLEDTQVTIEIVAIDEGLSLRFGEVALDAAGESALVGTGAEFHADGETLLLVDDRHTEQVYSLTFRLSADIGYADSEEYTLQFIASNEGHHEDVHTD